MWAHGAWGRRGGGGWRVSLGPVDDVGLGLILNCSLMSFVVAVKWFHSNFINFPSPPPLLSWPGFATLSWGDCIYPKCQKVVIVFNVVFILCGSYWPSGAFTSSASFFPAKSLLLQGGKQCVIWVRAFFLYFYIFLEY